MTQNVVVVNPLAGGGRAGAVWDEIHSRVREAAEVHVVRAQDPVAAGQEIAGLLERGIERLIVVGGDGSVHMAGNFLLHLGRGCDVALGLVPVGTGSDLARTLGLPRDPALALQRALTVAPRALDAIEIAVDDGRKHFVLNVASAGIGGLVDATVNALPNRGQLAYLRATLGAFLSYRAVPCRVRLDDADWHDGPVFLLAVANGTAFGRGMRVAPEAKVDDGQLDVVLVGDVPVWRLAFHLPQIYRGTHLSSRLVRWQRARRVRIEPAATLPPFDVDGDTFTSGPATFTVLPGALRILA